MQIDYLTFIDLIIPPIFLVIFYFAGNAIKQKYISNEPYYKYFVPGLLAKLFGAVAICLVYVFYYQGGDTTGYYHDCVTVIKTFLKDPYQMTRFTFFQFDNAIWNTFDIQTDWIIYAYDSHAMYVVRLTWILCAISFQSFIGTTMLLAFICYFAIWRLFKVLVYEFPGIQGQLAFSIFYIPSVVFWGSGLLKDSITFAAVALFTSSFHFIIRQRKNMLVNFILLVIASLLLLKIKPYIFFAILPGSILWLVGIWISGVKNKFIKASFTPIMITISVVSGYMVLRVMGDSLGEYRVENVLNKAVVTQQDLKQDYYRGSSFDIGEFEPTVAGILSKAPIAIMTALFRPYLWEAYNPGMIVSSIENSILLILTIYLLFKLRVYNLFRLMFRHHFLFFSIAFSLFFAFSVGLTTSNFGSLVRYKIPAVPFFVASLFIIAHTYTELRKESKEKEENADAISSSAS